MLITQWVVHGCMHDERSGIVLAVRISSGGPDVMKMRIWVLVITPLGRAR